MQLMIQSTDVVAMIDGVPRRLWRGLLSPEIEVEVWVHKIGISDPHAQAVFDRLLPPLPEMMGEPPPATGKSRPTLDLSDSQIRRIS